MANASGLWIPVLPSLDGFGPALTKGVAKDAEKAGKTSGKAFGLALGAAAATVAGVAAAGTALFNVGKTFQDMTNTIRIGTGAAGDDLDGLVDIAKNVGTKVPADFDAIGNAVADLNTMMGLTGDDLELVSSQVLEAGRMLGEEVDISAVGQSFNAFGVEAEDVSGSLDFLFNVSQATGIGMNDLANQARQAAPAAEVLGFTFEETAGLIGQLDNAGLDSGKMLQNMSRRMKDVAKDGEEPRDTFNRVASEIEEMVESGDRFGAQDLAGTAFGTRNAEQFIKAIEDGTMNLEDLTGAAAHSGDTIMGLSEETMTFGEHWEIFKNEILVALEPIAARVFGGMSDLMQGLGERLTNDIIPAFEGFVGWLDRAKTWLIPLAGVLAGVAGSIIAVNTAISIWTAVTKAWNAITVAATAIQKGFNAVLKANPIGLIITAVTLLVGALVWFFTQTETGQKMWQKFTDALAVAWEWVVDVIGTAATWLWEDVLQPVINWISDAWTTMSEWFVETYENWIKPVFDGIATVAQWLWTAVLFVVFAAIVTAWTVLSTAISWAWENVLKPAWDAIATAAIWLWETILSPVFDWIGKAWQYLLLGISWYWENVLKPAWDAISVAATWLWENILKPVFGYIGSQWRTTLDNMKWVWNNVLKPAWDKIVEVVTWLWEDVLKPTFNWISDAWDYALMVMVGVYQEHLRPMFSRLGDAVEDLKGRFETAVDNIGKAWDKIKEIAAKPIYFVIQRVLNEGLIAGFNNTLGKIPGVKNLGEVAVPQWMKEYGYARGGYTGDGGKYEPAGVVHRGEYVLPKESTSSLMRTIGIGGLEYMRHHGRLPGYASGGLVQPVRGPLTSRFGASRGRYPHAGVDWAVPIGTPVRAALAGTALGRQPAGRTGRYVFLSHPGNRNTYYGHLSRPMVSAGDEVAKGQVIGLSGNTGNSTGPHLHFETWTGGKPVNPLSYMGGLPASASGGETGGGFDLLAPFRALGDKVLGWITDKFPGAGPFVDAGVGVVKKSFTDVVDWVTGILGFGGDTDSDGGSGPAKDQVRDVATRFGWDSGAQWSALDELIRRESSWNVNAANPRSSARGLFQKMTSIHGPVASTAAGQAEWGLKYIRDRHNDPIGALAHHDRRNWYADGGLVNGPLLRDTGGELPRGLSMILNNRPESEWILNKPQIDQMADNFAARGTGMEMNFNAPVYMRDEDQFAEHVKKLERRELALQAPL